ncbi:MAG TPA: hypothetical protein VMU34_13250 [Mycobacterium sp.]|nr:hypothetical protein [Mycobacterium sp.]
MKVMFDGQDADLPQPATGGYVAVWLQLDIRRMWHLPAFMAAIGPVIEQARHHRGLRRFGFVIDWWQLRFRTFGAFDTDESLREFVESEAHGMIYHRLRGRLGRVTTRYGVIDAADLPRHWDEVSACRFSPVGKSSGR